MVYSVAQPGGQRGQLTPLTPLEGPALPLEGPALALEGPALALEARPPLTC